MHGTFYGDTHLKDLLGSFATVRYFIPVLDFYLVLPGLRRQKKSTIMDRSINVFPWENYQNKINKYASFYFFSY